MTTNPPHRVHPVLRPLFLGALQAYSRNYCHSLGCFEMDKLPDGTSLGEALSTRYSQSLYETVAILMLDACDPRLDVICAEAIAVRFGPEMSRFAVALTENRGGPTRAQIEQAYHVLRNNTRP